jgi:acyl transferase domain-containing protein/acyl carrier protein/enoyl-[acyl-carrier-protein] reductase (NADH)
MGGPENAGTAWSVTAAQSPDRPGSGSDIAIIGIQGRFPRAANTREYWHNLKEGICSIAEIPGDRWDVAGFYSEDGGAAKSYCKWGGFLEGVDRFEAAFFNIAPREAELMDPQQRLFMEVVWGLLEDAGYTPETLTKDTGVFVGVIAADYGTLTNQAALLGESAYRDADFYQIPNRISYFYDFHGPSIAVDTACSSAGTALHLACAAIRAGECGAAVVGGINLFLHPGRFIQYAQMQVLSHDRRCRPFGAGATGTIYGEGVGAVLLKPLSAAKRDGDHIYAVIKGSAVNASGKTTGFTVPNPVAQQELISRVFAASGIDARTVSYVEAHGTGTPLGDPIEIRGLTEAYRSSSKMAGYEDDAQYCAIGSVKSNIGHLESGAAMAGLIKILLQMKHGILVPSLHAEELNPLIPFERTPFYLQRKREEWLRPRLTIAGRTVELPRRAGLSSFGAGGVNTHFLLEEYREESPERAEEGPLLFPFSSGDETQLKQVIRDFLDLLPTLMTASGGARLSDIAFTLQVGRRAMRSRVAVIAAGWEELREKLGRYCEGGPDNSGFYRGAVKETTGESPVWPGDPAEQERLSRAGLEKLAVLWAGGTAIDWRRLHDGGAPRRVPLPTYRFNGERYWIAHTGTQTRFSTAVPPNNGLRPSPDGNHSGFDGPGFRKTLSGKDQLLRDHVVNGRMVLPGVAYLEMARVAAQGRVRKFKRLVWVRPVIVQGEEPDFQISILPEAGRIHGTAWTAGPSGRPVTHAEWEMELEDPAEAKQNTERTDIQALLDQCAGRTGKSECYELLAKVGYQYGKSFQVIDSLHYRADLAVSRLELQEKSDPSIALPPSLLDGALQTVTCWISMVRRTPAAPYVPFTIGEVEIRRPLNCVCYAVVSEAPGTQDAEPDFKKYNLLILNEAGELLVRIDEYYPRPFRPENAAEKEIGPAAELFFRSDWEEEELPENNSLPAESGTADLIFGNEDQVSRWKTANPDQNKTKIALVKPGEQYRDCGGRVYEINPGSEADYEELVQTLESEGLMPARIVYLWDRGDGGSGFTELQLQLERGFHSLRLLCKALSAGERAEPVNILYAFDASRDGGRPQFAALGGMARSIYRENPKFSFKVVELCETGFTAGQFEAIVGREMQNRWRGVADIRYESGKRFRKRIRPVDPAAELPVQSLEWLRTQAGLRPGGVYLITGGLGGLGLIFAGYLAGRVQARLVLSGRSDPGGPGAAGLKQLQQEHPEAEISYIKADISKRLEVRALVAAVKSRYGRLDGIIHAAGTIRDSLLIHKTRADAEAVIAPKVWGSVWLDEETSREKLDFFIMFSSTASVAGHIGQTDYAYANRFLDEFAPLREVLRRKGLRHGKTLAINWPWWRDGGMRLGEHALKHLEQLYGLRGLDTGRGLEVFETALQSRGPNLGFLIGDPEKLDGWMETGEAIALGQAETVESAGSAAAASPYRQALEIDLIRDAADILKLPLEKIDPEAKLSNFGFDSITFTGFANRINGRYNLTVSPAHFYEYRTLASFAAFLRREYGSKLKEYYDSRRTSGQPGRADVTPEPVLSAGLPRRIAEWSDNHRDTVLRENGGTDVAVIGIAGQFPQSENVEEFWTNLVNGRDLISEIPAERWDWREYYGRPGAGPDRTDVKWGGFMKDVDRFDASFFGISPREAAYIDPQQRLFLETVWRAIEDAGYSPAGLSGSATGLFVGASLNDYNELIKDYGLAVDAFVSSGVNNSIIANRVSYLLNLRGPSEVIDTACSSSLVALKRAVESISSGDCSMAIAGGVNVILRPKFHISFRMTGMLSGDGRCKTFDRGADGYVRGEGVGAVLLKPLKEAVADGDQIYAVIKAVAENHGGGAQSLTAPNPKAQAELIVAAYRKAGIPVHTVSYIEAHGTGTALGDPIEVQGLKTAFAGLSAAITPGPGLRGYCGLGSVKTNIGHLEAASGIASVIKVLLALKHRTLPASLHFKALNPYIELADSPFYIVDRTRPWEPLRDGGGGVIPRRAGVSSFGFGGTNAHVVLEEYYPKPPPRRADAGPQLIVLSARDRERLTEYAGKLRDYLENHGEREEASLENIAGTLQTGREAMSERLAVLAGDVSELKQLLTGYIEGETAPDRLFTGRAAPGDGVTPTDNPAGINGADLADLARSWVNGARIDWKRIGGGRPRQRISLPTYPFARERHWLPQPAKVLPAAAVSPAIPASGLHPLLDANQSTLNGIRFVKRFTGAEFYLTDHLIGGQKVLPGVAYLEMARAAGAIAGENRITRIRNIAWVRPLAADAGPVGVELTLNPAGEGLRYEISSADSQGGRISHAQGLLICEAESRPPLDEEYLDLTAIEARAVQNHSGREIYERFEIDGSAYRQGMQSIRELVCGPGEALALLRLPPGLEAGFSQYTLHPAIMDGALQTVAALLTREELRDGGPFLPFTIGEMTITHPPAARCYAYAALAEREYQSDPGLRRYRIRICDESGKVLVKVEDYCVRPLRRSPAGPCSPTPPALETICWREEWVKLPAAAAGLSPGGSVPDTIWLWSGDAGFAEALKHSLKRLDWDNTRVIRILSGTGYGHPGRDVFQIDPARRENLTRLVEELTRNGSSPDWIIFDWLREAAENRDIGPDAPAAPIVNAAFHLNQELLKGQPAKAIRQLHLYPEIGGGAMPDQTIDLVKPALCGALSGFARTVALEYPNFRMTTLAIPSGNEDANALKPDQLAELLLGELYSGCETEVKYENGCRYGKRLKEIDLDGEDRRTAISTGFKQGGVYLITGGAGGLGRILARHLAEAYRAKLILTGRASLTGERQRWLHELENAGAEVLYVEADISAPEDVRRLARLSRERFAQVDGIFHCAGVLRDALLSNQTAAALQEVLAPKIKGTVYLERYFRELRPDFLMLFSSLTAVAGNTGQSDYAFGNRFMCRYAELYNETRPVTEAFRMITVNWPYWEEGGMRLNRENQRFLAAEFGMAPLDTAGGLRLLVKIIAGSHNAITVVKGEGAKVRRWMESLSRATKPGRPDPASALPDATGFDLQQAAVRFATEIRDCLAGLLGLKADRLKPEDDLSGRGLNSIIFVDLANRINQYYSLDLTPSFFFQYATAASLAAAIFQAYQAQIVRFYAASRTEPPGLNLFESAATGINQQQSAGEDWGETEARPSNPPGKTTGNEPVAIIGMQGMMPGSDSLADFWENLQNGVEMVGPISPERWRRMGYHGPKIDPREWGGRGGFLKDIERFDAGFFNISQKEAELMDPQQRLFLETVWKTVEDAGYRPADLSGTDTGVYAGVANSDYYDVIRDSGRKMDAYVITGKEHSILANRISYLFNLHGPSEPVNTACSSSLVAVHRAVEALRGGQCGMAIAGGVNILSSRAYYGAAADAGMLARDGRCKTFDRRADGYVRGEGCGALLLKRLSDAERDRDHIYAIIKGTAVNHCGRTSSLTAPGSGAQADLLVAAYSDAQIAPGTVSYIETHGTGTELGDPIEIEGLQQAFRELYRRAGKTWPSEARTGLGSVKTAIGHLEAAAGIAGLFKVLLALKNKRIPGNLHLDEVNPYIRLEGSPFYLMKETVAWETPPDESGRELPRRAGVSSFGVGGSNAHIILEEYRERPGGERQTAGRPQLIVLSAKNGDRLREYAEALLRFVENALSAPSGPSRPDLCDIAYTLQIGREAFNTRLACVVATLEELAGKLQRFRGGITETPGLYSNGTGAGERPVAVAADTAALLRNRDLDRLAMLWVSGQEIDWKALQGDGRPRRISLPAYPFAPDRYWAGNVSKRAIPCSVQTLAQAAGEPQPQLHFYRNEWIEQPPGNGRVGESQVPGGCILIFERDNRTGAMLRELLAPNVGFAIVSVRPGAEFAHPDPDLYSINPGRAGDYRQLFAALAQAKLTPGKIIHIWARESYCGDPETLRIQMEMGLFSVFRIARTLMTVGFKERVSFLFGYFVRPEATNPPFDAVSGFMRNAGLETNKIGFKTVAIRTAPETAGEGGWEWPAGILLRELESDQECEVRYEGPARLVRRFRNCEADTLNPPTAPIAGQRFAAGGVYLITGGAGGLGMIFARSLAGQAKVKLVLCGRSPLDDGIERKLESLRKLGAEALYLQADISADYQSRRLLGEIKARFGRINGIIHSAGTLRDGLIPQKSAAALQEVLGPKVYGAVNLDQATQEDELDFFILFSSIAASRGNVGQCDYAYANAFLDSFAHWREALRMRGQRRGKTVAVGWSYWRDGGMRVSTDEVELYTRRTGLFPLPAAEGVKALEICLQSGEPHLLATYGTRVETDNFLGITGLAERGGAKAGFKARRQRLNKTLPPSAFRLPPDFNPTARLIAKMCGYLRIIFEELLGLETGVMEEDAPFLEYGIDSILIKKFNQRIADRFEALPKTLLFEFRNLHELAEYFVAHHRRRVLEISPEAAGMAAEDPDSTGRGSGKKSGVSGECQPERGGDESEYPRDQTGTDIAIIGISGRYPQAENPEEFWSNLRSGRDCITGIPESRWDNRPYFDPDPNKANEGKIYCDRGGFIDNADKFDSAFFHISPREAEAMDPQERLFLQTAWEVLEDAGYAGMAFENSSRKNRYADVGVFVGVTNHSYSNVGMEQWYKDPAFIPSTRSWFIANRVSYFLGFRGPSMPVDTACSSSLSAVYLACESIKRGECALAIAGGVNLHFHHFEYLQMCAAKMLSPQGVCRSFGAGSDGFVPGEGVGAVLLKPLAQAVKDRDHIYAVIKGGAINHGGRTNGFTVPNPQAQADVIALALHKAGVDPATISYIEAHGTGTELGDPIEIEGLTRAFREYTSDKQFCAVGSVKSNIGHLEAAAGIAGITKIILQLRHREIPPSLHVAELNPNIDFESSPFFIQRQLSRWQSSYVTEGKAEHRPLRAGISSFGAGGVNVHLVLEEFTEKSGRAETGGRSERARLIVLSAANEERLRVCAARLAAYLERTVPGDGKALVSDEEAINRLNGTIRVMVSRLAGTDENEIDYETALVEYGLDPVALMALTREIREEYGLPVTCGDIGPQSTVRSLSNYLWENFSDEIGRFEPAGTGAVRLETLFFRLEDIAFTLQTGRAALEERLALVVFGVAELVGRLKEFSRGNRPGGCVYTGRAVRRQRGSSTAEGSEAESAGPVRERELSRLAELWVSGAAVDWMTLYSHEKPRRIPLPVYPFELQRYWPGSHGESSREAKPCQPVSLLKEKCENNRENKEESEVKIAASFKKSRRFAGPGAIRRPVIAETGPGRAEASERTTDGGAEAALREKIREMLAAVLYLKPGEIDENKPFIDLGLDSILGVELINNFNKACHTAIKATKLYDHATVAEFAKYAAGIAAPAPAGSGGGSPVPPQPEKRAIRLRDPGPGRRRQLAAPSGPAIVAPAEVIPESPGKTVLSTKTAGGGDIAIIGMAVRYPGAKDPWKLWRMLEKGGAAVREVPPERWDIRRHYDPDKTAAGKSYCKYGGFLEEIDRFDPLFFNISPAEAVQIEPQQRLFLQEAWRALENAGYSLEALNNLKCGVYVGVGSINEYNPGYMFNTSSILAARIAYFLNLKGPAVSIDTACSSSLAAIHMACRCLRDGEAEMMLAGGVTLYLTEKLYIQMCRSEMLSPDGKCKSFAAGADGFVPAEGVGALVLKRLDRAIRDGDYIYGVIKGSGMNQDGRTNGITAPSAKSQRELEIAVYEQSGIDPATISYVEAHGTGTQLGDPIEFEALNDAFRNYTAKKQFCGLGSIKTNLGHTAAASGVAGVVKVLLALEYGKIPPSLNFKEPNRHIDLADSPFYVGTELRDWRGDSLHPRRAAVSSFGFSGTNVHLVLEEAPTVSAGESRTVKPFYMIPLSAKSAESLVRRVADLRDWLEPEVPEHSLADISYTLLTGRSHFGFRLALVVASREELRERLAKLAAGGIPEEALAGTGKGNIANKAVFSELGKMLFGQLQTYPGIGDELYREKLTALAELFGGGHDLEWRDLFAPGEGRKIPLPMYPFTAKRYWMTPAETPKKGRPQPDEGGLSRSAVEMRPLRPDREQTVQILTALFSKSFYGGSGETGSASPAQLRLVSLDEKNRGTGGISSDFPETGRAAFRLKAAQPVHPGPFASSNLEKLKTVIRSAVMKVLYLEPGEIDDDKRLAELGMDSVIGVELVNALNRKLQTGMDKSRLYEYPTINALAEYLLDTVRRERDYGNQPN